jgi:hypothetical protein
MHANRQLTVLFELPLWIISRQASECCRLEKLVRAHLGAPTVMKHALGLGRMGSIMDREEIRQLLARPAQQ